MRLKIKISANRFSGGIGECWQKYADEYRQVTSDNGFKHKQKIQYLHSILFKHAQRYYQDRVEGFTTNFNHATELIYKEYNFLVRQNRVKNYFASLRILDFIDSKIDAATALSRVYKTILKL